MIKPTVGRVVWFYDQPNQDRPHAAIIAHVWSDTCVNLACFDANGKSGSATSVPLIQEETDPVPERFYCVWMPYQKGQAAKTEALEEKISEENAA